MYSPSLTFTTIVINISLKKISASARFLVLSMSTYLTLTGIPMCRMPSVWRPMSTWRQRLSKLVCSDTGWLPSHTNSGQNSLVSCVSMCLQLFIIFSMPSTLTLFNCRPAWNDWISMLRACFCDVYMPITAIVIVTSTLYVIFALYPEERESKMKIFFFHVAWVWDYMNEQLIVKSVFLCITMQLLSALQDSQMQLKFKTSRYIHPSIQISLHWDKERSLMRERDFVTSNYKCWMSISAHVHLWFHDILLPLVLTLLLPPSLQSKLSEISEEGSQAERKQEVLELHNEVLQWVNVLC